MSRKIKQPIQALKGFKDILPEDQKFWDFIYNRVYQTVLDYGFKKIDPPILEDAHIYMKGTGQYSDIVEKELYVFEDKGGGLVALRPEFTPGVVRSYIEHGMQNQPQPVKLFSFGPIFRHDNPQAGRFRQFYQFNCEIIGSDSPDMDSQLITMLSGLFKIFGLDTVIEVNSIGCHECRPTYIKQLVKFLKKDSTKLCATCQERIVKNPLRVLDCKNKACVTATVQAPQIVDYLCETCKKHFVKVLENLDDVNIIYSLNSRLVRGLDYYTRTVFEVFLNEEVLIDRPEGAEKIALAGGGRLDGLAEILGGRPTPVVGVAGGVERVISAMRRLKIDVPDPGQADVFIAQLGEEAKKKCLKLFEDMRHCNIKVREAFSKNGLKAQLEVADKMGVKYTLILGQKEIMDGTIIVRDMFSGIQEIVVYEKVVEEIKKRLLDSSCVKIYLDETQKKSAQDVFDSQAEIKEHKKERHYYNQNENDFSPKSVVDFMGSTANIAVDQDENEPKNYNTSEDDEFDLGSEEDALENLNDSNDSWSN